MTLSIVGLVWIDEAEERARAEAQARQMYKALAIYPSYVALRDYSFCLFCLGFNDCGHWF